VLWQALLASGLDAELFYGALEAGMVLRAQRGTGLPDLVGRQAMQASGASGVGVEVCGLDVGAGPQAGVAGALTVLLGPNFQRADAGFDGTIICGRAGWREELIDTGAV
jgi:hypothetical protein